MSHPKPRHRGVHALLIGLGAVAAGATPSLAQPPLSRGQQFFPISYQACLDRAAAAFRSQGWVNIGNSGNQTTAFKGIHSATIICNEARDGQMVVNIVVASSNGDGNVPGQQRVLLQQAMSGAATPLPPPPPSPPVNPSTAAIAGRWQYSGSCPEGAFGGLIELNAPRPDGGFSGKFTQANEYDVGTIEGRVVGSQIQFTRKATFRGTSFEQTWTATISGANLQGGVIGRPTERLANCTFTAKR